MVIIGQPVKEGQECDALSCTAPAEYGILEWEHLRLCSGHASMYAYGLNPPKDTRERFDKINKERGEEDV